MSAKKALLSFFEICIYSRIKKTKKFFKTNSAILFLSLIDIRERKLKMERLIFDNEISDSEKLTQKSYTRMEIFVNEKLLINQKVCLGLSTKFRDNELSCKGAIACVLLLNGISCLFLHSFMNFFHEGKGKALRSYKRVVRGVKEGLGLRFIFYVIFRNF